MRFLASERDGMRACEIKVGGVAEQRMLDAEVERISVLSLLLPVPEVRCIPQMHEREAPLRTIGSAGLRKLRRNLLFSAQTHGQKVDGVSWMPWMIGGTPSYIRWPESLYIIDGLKSASGPLLAKSPA